MFELSALRYFVSAYEAGTFSKAARDNGVSQPTVSAAIQKLEDRLGEPLFLRSKSGLTPNPLARRLYHDTLKSVVHLSTLESRILNQPKQEVRVHCAPDMLVNNLALGLNGLRHEYPDLIFSFTSEICDSDIAYTTDVCAPDAYKFIMLEEEPFGVAFAHKHPLAGLSVVRFDDISKYPIIRRPYCPHADHVDITELHITPSAHATNDAQLMGLVAADLGIAFTPRTHAQPYDNIGWAPLQDVETGSRRSGICHRRSALATNLAQKLTKTLKI